MPHATQRDLNISDRTRAARIAGQEAAEMVHRMREESEERAAIIQHDSAVRHGPVISDALSLELARAQIAESEAKRRNPQPGLTFSPARDSNSH